MCAIGQFSSLQFDSQLMCASVCLSLQSWFINRHFFIIFTLRDERRNCNVKLEIVANLFHTHTHTTIRFDEFQRKIGEGKNLLFLTFRFFFCWQNTMLTWCSRMYTRRNCCVISSSVVTFFSLLLYDFGSRALFAILIAKKIFFLRLWCV